jgi:hypothetical protein
MKYFRPQPKYTNYILTQHRTFNRERKRKRKGAKEKSCKENKKEEEEKGFFSLSAASFCVRRE